MFNLDFNISDLFLLFGIGLLIYGRYLVSFVDAIMVSGLALIALALLFSPKSKKEVKK